MKLSEEGTRSYIDDVRCVELLKFLTWKGDVCPTWWGDYMPATHSDDEDLVSLARFNRCHYLFYRTLVEDWVERRGAIMDLGCGTGQRTAMLARYADDVLGLDNEPLKVGAASYLNQGGGRIRYVLGDIMRHDAGSLGTYDYLFCVEVIEHLQLHEQAAFIRRALGWLNKGGRMLITTPRDRKLERKPPHVGLWGERDAERIGKEFGGMLHYFNVAQLADGEDPRCGADTGTHYVMVIEK